MTSIWCVTTGVSRLSAAGENSYLGCFSSGGLETHTGRCVNISAIEWLSFHNCIVPSLAARAPKWTWPYNRRSWLPATFYGGYLCRITPHPFRNDIKMLPTFSSIDWGELGVNFTQIEKRNQLPKWTGPKIRTGIDSGKYANYIFL